MYNLTKDQLQKCLPKNKEVDAWLPFLNKYLNEYDINTDLRVAAFLSQMAHESNQFTVLEENLNYSATGLKKTFGKYFRDKNPADYARKPEKIANLVYGGRMGNYKPDDGYRFRGGGIIQYTGRDNYTTFGRAKGMTAEQAVDYVRTKEGAVESACFYWTKIAKLNDEADRGDIKEVTFRINGGYNGLDDRIEYYNKMLPILKQVDNTKVTPSKPTKPAPTKPAPNKVVAQRGDRNDTVKKIQRALGISADGIFGLGTYLSVKRYQQLKGLPVTGVVDQVMLDKLGV